MRRMEEERKKKIRQSINYMDWIIDFAKDHPIFSDNLEEYKNEKITEEELEKIKKLEFFFEWVQEYADNNYILPERSEWGESYNIEKNNQYYKIGCNRKEGNSFYCERIEKPEESIGYYSLANQIEPYRTTYISKKLQEYSDKVKDLAIAGVPFEWIEKTYEMTKTEIESSRVLKKERKK